MNTSAPICISSYIKGQGSRPTTKGGARRQASFNHTGGHAGGSAVRRGQSSSGANVADLGIVAGQTMNLSRANGNKDAAMSGIIRSQGVMGAAIASQSSALNGIDDGALSGSQLAGAGGSIQPSIGSNPRMHQQLHGYKT